MVLVGHLLTSLGVQISYWAKVEPMREGVGYPNEVSEDEEGMMWVINWPSILS